ncbi:MAG: hypothetical protein ACYS8K_08795 [Planctomycetota bacterium]
MDLTAEEEKFLEPYLAAEVSDGKGWVIGVAVGALACAAAVFLRFTHAWPAFDPYFLLVVVVGLVIVEQSVNRRDKVRLARILQKYDSALRRLRYPGEQEETI